ncbi:helix-turn-helix transcriptional regulator [Gammaproteobacteria bacterium]|nr:helix-turn-helix transcriptional regulator [Gammaproteobacteria bacterium]MDC1503306.1 helix-turn-helix transcriptional regulator [Gammaproteobacteria bacterium]
MPRTSFKNIDCPVAQGAELIGDKWKILILRNAFFGITRFDDFLQSLNISSKVLSARLAEMVDDGILARETSETDKRAKLYSLTEKGKDLLTFTVSLAQWSERWDQKESIKFITKSSGKLVERVTLRSASGEKVRHDDVVVAQGRAKSSELSAIRKILANRV